MNDNKLFLLLPLILLLLLIFLVGFIIYDNYNLEEMNNKLRIDYRKAKVEIKKLRQEKLELLINGG